MSSRIEALKETAREEPKTIVLPEGEEPRVLQAASIVTALGIADIILLGNERTVRAAARQHAISLVSTQIVDPAVYPKTNEMAELFYTLRSHKGITREEAKEKVLGNSVYFAALLVRLNKADGFVAGASHTTSNVARAALYCLGLKQGVGTMSSSFVIELENASYGDNGLLVYGDCGIVPNPDEKRLADIAISSSELFEDLFERKPRVALLSYSTKGSAKGPSVDTVRGALAIINERDPDLIVDGELQFDAALVPEVAKIKAPKSKVAGRANVLIFPNLDAGNIAYKMTQRLGNARVVGPIIQGLTKPCCDLSRGCGSDEIVDGIIATVVRAQK
jgi:phosphate acetyltransferase